jgi:hypothetical protein
VPLSTGSNSNSCPLVRHIHEPGGLAADIPCHTETLPHRLSPELAFRRQGPLDLTCFNRSSFWNPRCLPPTDSQHPSGLRMAAGPPRILRLCRRSSASDMRSPAGLQARPAKQSGYSPMPFRPHVVYRHLQLS